MRRKKDYRLNYTRVGSMSERERAGKRKLRIWLTAGVAILAIAAVIVGVFLWSRRRQETAKTLGTASKIVGSESGTAEEGLHSEEQTDSNPSGSVEEESQKDTAVSNSTGKEHSNTQDVAASNQEREQADSVKIKGIYVTGPMAGSKGFDNLLTLVDTTELNAMVIDVKNDDGKVTWNLSEGTAKEIGACAGYVSDMEGFMALLKEHHIYTIARIACFKDPILAREKSELGLKKPDGTAVTDGNGLAWVNPCRQEVWDYLVELGREAAKIGFDEVQFDYVRFPIGKDAREADYGMEMTSRQKRLTIRNFLSYATTSLHEEGIQISADVFGTIIGNEEDADQVGQEYDVLGRVVDAVCPMVYPSHYASGVFGLEVPDANPYETIAGAMAGSVEELELVPEENRATVRPWLQAFTATWVKGHIPYGGEQIRAQIQAVYDAGYEEWILWNASNKYSADGLEPAQE